MNTIKILHCADIHIGAAESFLSALAPSRRYETLLTFEKIVDIAVENSVSVLVIAGDLFDSNTIEAELVEPVFNKIASIPKMKVIFAAGNHDPLSNNSPFKNRELPKNLFVLKTKDDLITFEDLNLRVYGKSFEDVYMKGTETFSLVPPTDSFINLMVLHGETGSDLNSQYNSITPNFIKSSNMDYIALGHIHKKSEIGKLGNTFFAYSGCPEGQGFDELGEKGVYLGEIAKGICNLEFIPVSKRLHIHEKIDVTGLLTSGEITVKILDTIKNNYGEGFNENLYKIELIGDIPEEANLNLTEILSRVSAEVYFAKIKDSTEILIDTESLAKEVSLKGLFVKNMLKRMENAEGEELKNLKSALKLGLKAFNSEVLYED